MDRTSKLVTDGVLAGSACMLTTDVMAQSPEIGSNPLLSQLLIPVVTGLIVPFIKELIMDMRERRRERKKHHKQEIDNSK